MRKKILLISMVLLSGCTPMEGRLDALRQAKLDENGNFNQAMASEYLAYAEALAQEGHPIRANYFAGKGLDALSGDVEPENNDAFAEQRQALMAVLTDDMKEVAPKKAARAQLLFDCRVQKEGVCKASFDEALSELQAIGDVLVHGDSNEFEARFNKGSASSNPQISATLDVIAQRVSHLGAYEVTIDTGGGRKALASKRVLTLEKGLIARGVDAGRIKTGNKASKAVLLSVDKGARNPNTIMLSIQTFTVAEERK